MRTICNISSPLKPLDDVITTEFMLGITEGTNCSKNERKLISLSAKFGGLVIPFFSETADRGYEFSHMLSIDLALEIINQERLHQERLHQPNENKSKIKSKIKTLL